MEKDETRLSGREIILGVSGSIAAYKALEVLRELMRRGAGVTCVLTGSAERFVTPLTFATLSRRPVLSDMFTLDYESRIGHISTAERADLLLVAPATANLIAKLAHGIADDFLTNLYLANRAPVLLAPAMNSNMYTHPAHTENLVRLRAVGVHIVEPETGELACGTVGPGRLADPLRIVEEAERLLTLPGDLAGEVVLVTAGPTREPLDPVRYISNRSSGKMGFALAEAARQRGARVILVSGPVDLTPPPGVTVIPVETAAQMRDATLGHLADATVVIMAAAVADYRPAHSSREKIKKSTGSLKVELVSTEDILEEISRRRGNQIVVGFAAETENLLAGARRKLQAKGLDLIVANDVTQEGAGFSSDTNIVTLLNATGAVEELPLLPKREVAHRILDKVVTLRRPHTLHV